MIKLHTQNCNVNALGFSILFQFSDFQGHRDIEDDILCTHCSSFQAGLHPTSITLYEGNRRIEALMFPIDGLVDPLPPSVQVGFHHD
jgi:hypothetical protein